MSKLRLFYSAVLEFSETSSIRKKMYVRPYEIWNAQARIRAGSAQTIFFFSGFLSQTSFNFQTKPKIYLEPHFNCASIHYRPFSALIFFLNENSV